MIKDLYEINYFACSIEKLYNKTSLTKQEEEYLLSCVILLLEEYDRNKEQRLFEFAYNIILRCAVKTGNLDPLYDVSCNYGFYPTFKFINDMVKTDNISIEDIVNDFKVETGFKNENYYETYEQHNVRTKLIESKEELMSFVAPTSSGKSSIVRQILMKNELLKKVVIIVPTKSLISQTYKDIRNSLRDRKVICHEMMYQDEENFVGILTQERLSRLLEKHPDLILDALYIDEAHNLFGNDMRSVLLGRVINACIFRNKDIRIMFLSPFVNDSSNFVLRGINKENEIYEQRITANLKEPSICEYRKDGSVYSFDRFSQEFYYKDSQDDFLSYIIKYSRNKNFIFLTSPRRIEQFAQMLYESIDEIEKDDSINEIQEILKTVVHSDFKMIEYLNKGIIYIHAKMPDQIKEFLEYQFKKNRKISYLIANSVILEGINLPIDSLFVMDLYNMNNSKLLNLIGRVNRLNNVFDRTSGRIDLLLPEIHFVNSSFYRYNMQKRITKLFDVEKDVVHNPLLENCSLDDIKNKNHKEKEAQKNKTILEHEQCLANEATTEIESLKRLLISSGMNQLVEISDRNIERILTNIKGLDADKDVIDMVCDVFIKDVSVIDKSFERLKNESAVNFYRFFLDINRRMDLSSLISSQVKHWEEKKKDDKPYMYVGSGYGEDYGPYEEGGEKGQVYIDLRKKTKVELANLLIVKTKIEQEFISFQYDRAVNFLHDSNYISDEKYNMEIYGTSDDTKIQLLNLGIPVGLLNLLIENNQISNLSFDANGNLIGNKEFKEFRKKQNSYWTYQIDKYLYFE